MVTSTVEWQISSRVIYLVPPKPLRSGLRPRNWLTHGLIWVPYILCDSPFCATYFTAPLFLRDSLFDNL
ncbi:hypothetical protein PENSPDRAFT_655805 [Peniophora sp. CONT]|nr:hypothetical protein PENSPDRAFT_655805 [Peniophora sp. CONT]